VTCEICREYPAYYRCQICGKEICGCCVRFIDGLAVPKSDYWEPELTLCKSCSDKLKLSIRIASAKKDKE